MNTKAIIGLCCYGCLFSWKLAFHHHNDHYELVLSASTAAEEKQWTSEIVKSTQKVEPFPWEPRKYSLLTLDVEPFERSTALGRKSSVHSLLTSRTNNSSQHVIIEKTHHPHSSEATVRLVEGEIERPRVLPPQGAISLVTRRQDRVRLEQFISDEYTSDVLQFPGMVLGFDDKRFKRKKGLSIHAKFTKRSASLSMIKNMSPGTVAHPTHNPSDFDGIISQPPRDLFPYDDEKGVVTLETSPEVKPQAGTLKLRKVSKRTPTSGTRSSSQGSKSYGILGSPSWKMSFGSLFHTVSMRKPKRRKSGLSGSES